MAPKLKLSDPHRTGAAELAEELKAVHDSLCEMEQSDDPSQLIPPTLPATLASAALLQHRDKAVRLLACCAVASCLRIYAPNAPYEESQLRTIFLQFWRELKYLQDERSPLYHLSYFLLESLATVRSAVLVWDLDAVGVELVLQSLLQVCFDQLSMSVKGKQCKVLLCELLQSVFEEVSSTAVPWEAVRFLCHQFEQPDTAPHALAKDVLVGCASRFQLPLATHYCELVSMAPTDSKCEQELRSFEALLCKLAKESAVLVVNVVPQLEQLLVSDQADQRQSAVKMAGQLLGCVPKSDAEHLFSVWSGRRNDKSSQVRATWLKSAVGLLSADCRFHAANTLLQLYGERLEDPDAAIRQRACEGLCEVPPALLNGVSSVVVAAVERCKDRREEVRKAALRLCAQLALLSKTVLNALFKLPLLHGDRAVKEEYDLAVESFLLSTTVPQMAAIVHSQLDPEAIAGFKHFTRSKATNIKHMQAFCLLFDQRDAPQAAAKLLQLIQMMAERSKYPLEASACLGNIAMLPDRDEVMAALKALKGAATPAVAATKLLSYLDTEHRNDSLPVIARRCSHHLFNQDFVKHLVDTADSDALLAIVLADFPWLFTNYGTELEAVMTKSHFDPNQMASFYRFVRSHEYQVSDGGLLGALLGGLRGGLRGGGEWGRRQVKWGALIVAAVGRGEELVGECLGGLSGNSDDVERRFQILTSLSRHLTNHPDLRSSLDTLKQLHDSLRTVVYKCDRYPALDAITDPLARSRVLLLRLLRSLASASDGDTGGRWRREALNVFLAEQSLPTDLAMVRAPYLGKVRWTACKGLLQVIPNDLRTLLSPAILPRVTQMAGDPVDSVRSRFYGYIAKLGKSTFWCALLALAAHDHSFQLRATVSESLKAISQSWRRPDYRFEHCLAVLVVLLAADMDPGESVHEQYQWVEAVLDYFLAAALHPATLPHCYATALCIKQYALGFTLSAHSATAYVVSELAARLIAVKAANHKWPIDAAVPADLSVLFPGLFQWLDQPSMQRNLATAHVRPLASSKVASQPKQKRKSDESENTGNADYTGNTHHADNAESKRRSERTHSAIDYAE